MSHFYLLKSEIDREKIGDVLIDVMKVDNVMIATRKLKCHDELVYVVRIKLGALGRANAIYKSLDKAKQVVKEVLGGRIDDASLKELLPTNDDSDD